MNSRGDTERHLIYTETLRKQLNCVNSTHDAYENTWKCGELKLYFFLSAGG